MTAVTVFSGDDWDLVVTGLDEPGPKIRIASWCRHCSERVTDREIDASTLDALVKSGDTFGVEDASAMKAHLEGHERRN